MAGKGGGAWKVAYADFVTAMMAFFMVMWLTAQKPEVKQYVAGYFRDPYAVFKGNESGVAADATPVEDPKLGHPAKSQPRRVPNSGDDANYKFAVLFAEGEAELDATARESIRNFSPTMVGKLNIVEVRAHCQRKPLPTESQFQNRWDLCYARSRAVQQELESRGVDRDRIRLSQSEANEPLAENLTDEELRLNSRVDVILLDDLIDSPWQRTREEDPSALSPGAGADANASRHEAAPEVESHEGPGPDAPHDPATVDSLPTVEDHGEH